MEPTAVPQSSRPAAPGIGGIVAEIWRAKVWVLVSTLVPAGIAAVIISLTPAKYKATATFVLPSSGGGLNPLAALALSKESSPISILYGVAASDEAYRTVAQRTGRSVNELKEALHWEMDSTINQISVSAEYAEKPRAVAVCQTAAAVMQKLSAAMSKDLAQGNLVSIEYTLAERQNDLAAAENDLLAFVKTLKTAPDPAQPLASGVYLSRLKDTEIDLGKIDRQLEFSRSAAIKRGEPAAVIPSLTGPSTPSWKQMVTQVEYELRVSETKFGPLSPEVESLKRKLAVTRRQAQQEIAKYIRSVESNVDSEIANLASQRLVLEWQREVLTELAKIAPSESIELQRLVREVGAQAEIVRTIRISAEATKLQKEAPQTTFTMLQPATLDPTPTNKGMSKPVGISALFGFLISSFCIVSRRRSGK